MSELVVEDLYTAYGRADVLCGVSLRARPGEITCILGSNGAGKSTLIRSILGLTPARRGRVLFDGENLAGRPTHEVVARGIAVRPFSRLTGIGDALRISIGPWPVLERVLASLESVP